MFSRLPRRILPLCVVCAVGLTTAVSAGAKSARAVKSKTVTITLHDYSFNPSTEKIAPGTTVRWHWEDGSVGFHNITPLNKKGGLLFKGASTRNHGYYSVKFTKKGTYYYECSVHPLTMQAKIIVT